jgi:esterase/lipase superfamily enzyme
MISQHQHQEVCDELQAAQERVAELSAHVELLKGELTLIYMHEFGYSHDDAVKQVELVFTIRENQND